MGRFWTVVGFAAAAVFIGILDSYFGKRDDDGQDGGKTPIQPPVSRPPPRDYYNYPVSAPTAARQRAVPPVIRTSLQRPTVPQRDDSPRRLDALRERANAENKRMEEAFSQSKIMRRSGMSTEAQRLAEEGKAHQRTRDTLNKTASEMIFQENNKDRKPNEVDLHRLYVKEAELKVRERMLVAQQRREGEVRFIVGQGQHSTNGAQLRPKLTSYIQEQ
ncbi:hypothetical protein K438DRAFT_614616 [Mycena galopus ATCC 62051]|nr:hypothetical protein K438DRAFT_614616 [Mycena galopus ATCC 62051]